MSGDVHVEQVPPGMTAALRQRVLRPHQSVAELVAETDPEAIGFAAFHGGAVVGSALVVQQPLPGRDVDAWRLRGMATAPEFRNRGVGSAVLAAVVAYVRTAGGTVLWANVRTAAKTFYDRHGFAAIGEPWEEPLIGPHLRMWRKV